MKLLLDPHIFLRLIEGSPNLSASAPAAADGYSIIQMKQNYLLSAIAILGPLLANVLAACVWLPLLTIPPGTAIRPMLQALLTGAVAFGTLVTGVPTGASLIASRRRCSGWLCLVFSVTPWFVALLVARCISSALQLTWAD